MVSLPTTLEPTTTTEIAGHQVAMDYGDPDAEYAALRASALMVDRSHRARIAFAGEKAAETVTGLVTNDVGSLTPGHGMYAAALTPKGKILADVRIFARVGRLLVDTPPRAAEGFIAMVRKYVNPRVTPYTVQTDLLGDVGVFGPHARAVVAAALDLDGEVLEALAPYALVETTLDGASVLVARVPDAGALDGFECIAPVETLPALRARLTGAGARPGGLAAFEIARIEAGRPEWGIDIDDSTIPQEANLDDLHAISYTKGCYTGQETVARVHFRGHVNRHLRGLRLGDAPVPTGAQLEDDTGKPVGEVRSVAHSPRLGWIALAMVRREIALETTVRARWADGEASVRVVAAGTDG